MGSIDGRPLRLTAALAALLALCTASRPASAGPAEDEARARKLFEQADALGNDGKWKEACQVFQTSYDVFPTGGTAFRTADCYDKINAWERAIPMYRWVVDHRASDKRQDRVTLAEQRLGALTKLVAAQKAPVQQGPVQQGPVQQGPVQSPPRGKPEGPPPEPNRVPAFVAFGVGGAGAIAGAILGGLALMQSADIKSHCTGTRVCQPIGNYPAHQFESDKAAMTAKAWGSNIALGLAVVGLATGTALYVLKVPKAAAAVQSAVGPDGIMLHF